MINNLAARYAYATQIPISAFKVQKLDPMYGKEKYEVSGKISDLPDSFITVGNLDVKQGIWSDWIDEKSLQGAETIQNKMPGEKLIEKPSRVCQCVCQPA